MQKTYICPESFTPTLGAYSHGVKVDLGHAAMLFVSGQLALDAEGNLVSEDVEEQTRFVFENIRRVLADAGASFEHVVNARFYLTDINDFSRFSPIRNEYLGTAKPASTLVQVSSLVKQGCRVEVDVIAMIPNGSGNTGASPSNIEGTATTAPIIRGIGPDESPTVGCLIRQTINDCYVGPYPPRAVEYFLKFHQDKSIRHRSETGLCLVAVKEGEILATGSLVGNEITGVFVKTDHQSQGIGNLLMDKLEEWAVQTGHQEVNLSISLPSRGFYEKRGYKIIRTAEIDVGMGQVLKYWEGHKTLRE